jgi:PadR family transcriptional regulator, regulatory protein PadR
LTVDKSDLKLPASWRLEAGGWRLEPGGWSLEAGSWSLVAGAWKLKGDPVGKPTDLVQGTVDLLILRTIALEPLHGWAIARRIRQISNDVLQVQQGSLYPALQRLEREGWITAEWGASENNRRARFYQLTKAGRKHLEREQAGWERLSSAIALVLRKA